MDQPPSILSVSSYDSLLQTREWVLKRAGFNVTSAHNFDEAMTHCRSHAFDIVIIGESFPSPHTQALIQALIAEVKKHRQSRVFSLFMRGDPALPGVDYALEALQGPEKLIEVIRAVLKRTSRLRNSHVKQDLRSA